MAANPDSREARITSSCPPATRQILSAAWDHDTASLKKLLDVPGKASLQDPSTGETGLHAAVRSSPATPEALEAAKAAVRELFLSGAIWIDVDNHNETPGCVALRLGQTELYNLFVEAGTRAELLFALMDGYEELSSGPEDEDMEDEEEVGEGRTEEAEIEANPNAEAENGNTTTAAEEATFVPPKPTAEDQVKSEKNHRAKLTYSDGKLADDAGNGVMMAWETDIMRRSVEALLPGGAPGKRILNIGFGMGIIDSMIAATKPARHHIIEAHPDVLARLRSEGGTMGIFSEEAPEDDFRVLEGRWQDVCPRLLEAGEVYDAIYFDTFAEDYGQLRRFFSEYVVGLLDQDGVFGFFNGLGADRRICYDVYKTVVEMHLADAGLDVEWSDVDVDMQGLDEAGKEGWEGVKRRYWTLDSKWCTVPIC